MKRWRIREEVIPPGQPSDNGFIESFQGSMREEILDQEIFENLREVEKRFYAGLMSTILKDLTQLWSIKHPWTYGID